MDKKWYKESLIYHVYPLGMLGAPKNNDFSSNHVHKLSSYEAWISYWKELGVGSVYFSPIFESGSHGYDTVDYYKIDQRLGSNNDFKLLSQKLSQSGISIILDGVFHHVGKDFFAFKDVQSNLRDSAYVDWFFIDFSKSSYGETFSYECWEGHDSLVKLNLHNHELREYLFNAVRHWIVDYNISGIRLDVAYALDHQFMRDLRKVCDQMKPDFVLLGEVIHGDYTNWLSGDMLDSVTNYECYKGLYSSHNDRNYFEIAYSLKRQFDKKGIYENKYLYNFADNHDVNRVASELNDERHLYPLYIMLMTMPGIPSIYYGSELGIRGKRSRTADHELRPEISIQEALTLSLQSSLFEHISSLSEIRSNSDALIHGDYQQLYINNEHFAYSRCYEGQEYLIMLNLSDQEVYISLENVSDEGSYVDLLNDEENLFICNSDTSIPISPNWGRILKKV